ncbi:ADP-ribosylglycohydrolase family protein [Nocardia sp. NPDC058658]|uniref:ADP-ribosylglycohydrolase family protein n=1 Tax=Nocardia sp. NPDC058658 TaxID=3346580 RepID=UPI003652713B
MACSVVAELHRHQKIDQDRLAAGFARRFSPERDYGHATVTTLRRIRDGKPWKEAAGAVFEGQGSFGNGAAMRVAPLGAYYADDPQRAAAEAVRSAQVTHMNPEGVTGAVAVAVAAGQAAHTVCRAMDLSSSPALIEQVERLSIVSRSGRVSRLDRSGERLGEAVHRLEPLFVANFSTAVTGRGVGGIGYGLARPR